MIIELVIIKLSGQLMSAVLGSERERQRGDREVWGVVGDNTVGIKEHVNVAVKVKYAYDKVFPGTATTEEVYRDAGIHDIVSGCLDGFNGTVFAYGVTSSGKTHTMLVRPLLLLTRTLSSAQSLPKGRDASFLQMLISQKIVQNSKFDKHPVSPGHTRESRSGAPSSAGHLYHSWGYGRAELCTETLYDGDLQ